MKCEFIQNHGVNVSFLSLLSLSHSLSFSLLLRHFIFAQFLLLIKLTRVSWHSKPASLIHCSSSVLSTVDEEKSNMIFTTNVSMSGAQKRRHKQNKVGLIIRSRLIYLCFFFLLFASAEQLEVCERMPIEREVRDRKNGINKIIWRQWTFFSPAIVKMI